MLTITMLVNMWIKTWKCTSIKRIPPQRSLLKVAERTAISPYFVILVHSRVYVSDSSLYQPSKGFNKRYLTSSRPCLMKRSLPLNRTKIRPTKDQRESSVTNRNDSGLSDLGCPEGYGCFCLSSLSSSSRETGCRDANRVAQIGYK